MILADASVVIDWCRGKDAKLQRLIPSLPLGVCGITQAEVLHGSRDPGHRRRLLSDLAAFQLVAIPDALWIAVGDNLATLRKAGVTVPLADVVLATVGAENDLEVWSRDPHFPAMQKHLPRLRLFQEPP